MSLAPRISVLIQTYNAERHLERVLRSVEGFDEVVVADMESTDSTRDIALRHGARVVVFEKKNFTIVEVYRQKAIEACSNPWVLVLDADELCTPQLRTFLYDDVRRDPEPHGFWIPRKNFFMGRWMKCYYPDYVLRFMPREGTTWAPRIHSIPEIKGSVLHIPRRRTDLALVHLANETYAESIAKMNKYTENERDRRRGSYSRLKLVFDPPFRFFKAYVLKGGFRQGWPGFIHAVMDSFYRFSALAKIEEERQNALPKDIDAYI